MDLYGGLLDHKLDLPAHATVVQNARYFNVGQKNIGNLMDFNF